MDKKKTISKEEDLQKLSEYLEKLKHERRYSDNHMIDLQIRETKKLIKNIEQDMFYDKHSSLAKYREIIQYLPNIFSGIVLILGMISMSVSVQKYNPVINILYMIITIGICTTLVYIIGTLIRDARKRKRDSDIQLIIKKNRYLFERISINISQDVFGGDKK